MNTSRLSQIVQALPDTWGWPAFMIAQDRIGFMPTSDEIKTLVDAGTMEIRPGHGGPSTQWRRTYSNTDVCDIDDADVMSAYYEAKYPQREER